MALSLPFEMFIKELIVHAPPRGEYMKYTRFEKARIIGARSLQVSLGAPVLIDIPESMIDPVEIAMREYDMDMIPITVKRDT